MSKYLPPWSISTQDLLNWYRAITDNEEADIDDVRWMISFVIASEVQDTYSTKDLAWFWYAESVRPILREEDVQDWLTEQMWSFKFTDCDEFLSWIESIFFNTGEQKDHPANWSDQPPLDM